MSSSLYFLIPFGLLLLLGILSVVIKPKKDKPDNEHTSEEKDFYKGKPMKKDVQEWYNEVMDRNN